MFLTVVAVLLILLIVRWFLRFLKVRNYSSKHVFITGCDSGFGCDLAKALDKLGFHVFAGCLTETGVDNLRKACSALLIPVHVDVTKDTSISQAVDFVERKLPKNTGLWAVVNNAGVRGHVAPIEWLRKEDFEQVLSVNLSGVIFTTIAFLPLLRQGPTPGRIVNISSIMGRYTVAPVPYSVAKYGVEGFSESIRRELYRSGISVHLIEPGFFDTGIVTAEALERDMNSRFKQLKKSVQEYYGQEYVDTAVYRSSKALALIMSKNTDAVVNAYIHAITAVFPKVRYVVGWDANILFRILWNLPEGIGDFFVTRAQPKPQGAPKH